MLFLFFLYWLGGYLRFWLACSSRRRRRPSRSAQPSASADSGLSSVWGLDAALMESVFVPQNDGQIKRSVDVEDPDSAWYSAGGPSLIGVGKCPFFVGAQYEVR